MAQAALMTVVDPCTACHSTVRTRQEALKCEFCGFWQHRTCGTGISRDTYRRAVRLGEDIPWVCDGCQTQSVDIPMVSFNHIQALIRYSYRY